MKGVELGFEELVARDLAAQAVVDRAYPSEWLKEAYDLDGAVGVRGVEGRDQIILRTEGTYYFADLPDLHNQTAKRKAKLIHRAITALIENRHEAAPLDAQD